MEKINVNSNEMVTITLHEYAELQRAKMGIDMIGASIGSYSADASVVKAVCEQFGYKRKEPEDA